MVWKVIEYNVVNETKYNVDIGLWEFFKYFDEYEEGERGRLNAFTYYNVYWDISWRLSQTVVKYKSEGGWVELMVNVNGKG